MSADSSMGAQPSNEVDVISMNEINEAPWNPVEDSPTIAPILTSISSLHEIPPIEEVQAVLPAEPVKEVSESIPATAPISEPVQEPESESINPVIQPVPISKLRVEIPEPSESDDDMPPLISSSSEESEESEESKDDSEESKDDSEEESDESEESKDSDDDLMVAVFPRPTCPRCDAALKALLTPSEESETDSDSARSHRLRPAPNQIPPIIVTLFKILLFLHFIHFLAEVFAPARRTYS